MNDIESVIKLTNPIAPRVTPSDVENLALSSAYLSPSTGWHHVYFIQKFRDIEVYNGLFNLTLKDGTVQYASNSFVANLAEVIDNASLTRNITPAQAIEKAASFNIDLNGAVMASDAFFPFPDCVEIADQAGIKAVVHPGGSLRDSDSVDYCNNHDQVMVMTGYRHFKH